jgi:hypothetical protein
MSEFKKEVTTLTEATGDLSMNSSENAKEKEEGKKQIVDPWTVDSDGAID